MKKNLVLVLCTALVLGLVGACSAPAPATTNPSSSSTEAPDPLQAYRDYIANHAIALDRINAKPVSYTRFDRYKVVLMGETHGTQGSFAAEIELIKYLNRQYGIKRLIVEAGPGDVLILNEYLSTGDEDLLTNLIKAYRGTSIGSVDAVQFYRDLHEYSRTLPDDQQIVLYAGDLQHSLAVGARAMQLLVPRVPVPRQIIDAIGSVHNTAEFARGGADSLKLLYDNLEEQGPLYENFLGVENSAKWRLILDAMQQGFDYYAKNDPEFREQCMIDQFVSAFQTAPGERWMGVFGSAHTILRATVPTGESEGKKPALANYLAHEYPATSGKVASITFDYFDSHAMNRDGSSTPIESLFPVFRSTVESLPSDMSFCPLDLDGSPFGQPGERSLESQQYILFIRGSKATRQI